MAEFGLRRAVLWAGLAFLVVLPPLALALDEPFYVTLFTRILIFALAAVSLDLILGFGGLVSFGHAVYLGLGAYGVGIFIHHAYEGSGVYFLPALAGTDLAWVAWPLALLACALFALVTGLIVLRTSGVYFIMITLAFAQMMFFFFNSQLDYGGEDGLVLYGRSTGLGLDLGDRATFYYLCLGLLLAVLYLFHRIVHSRFGQVLTGIRENERRMAAIGFPTFRYKLVAYVIAGTTCGLAGILMANLNEFVSPAFMHWTRSGELIVMVVLGGMGTLTGPVLGAVAFLLLEEVLSDLTQHWMAILGPILILIVLFARQGIYGLLGPRGDRP